MSNFWDSLQHPRTLAAMLLVFALLVISHLWSPGHLLDTQAFLYVNTRGTRPAWLDWIMLGITQLGSTMGALAIALAFILVDYYRLAYEIVLGSLALWVIVELIKAIVRRVRPFIALTEVRVIGYRARGRSFPSGHTSQAFFLAALMVQQLHTGVGLSLLLFGAAISVGLTRIYVGAHYPRDVLAGMILGSAWGLFVALRYGYTGPL